MPIKEKIDNAIKEAFGTIAMYESKAVVGLFSGGHDSLLACWLVSQHPKFAGVVWADTGTGTGETRQYIRDTCQKFDWWLYVQSAHVLQYEAQLVKHGFPSPATHHWMYVELKEKQMDKALGMLCKSRRIKRSQVAEISGLRRNESQRRMKLVKSYAERRNKRGGLEQLMINPIWDWTQPERDEAIDYLGLPRNAYADYTGHSYECMCYANVAKGERERRAIKSSIYEEIDQLREQMMQIVYKIQMLKLESGMIDQPALLERTLKQGWHLTQRISVDELEMDDPFHLCAPCMAQRSLDGVGGVDIDVELKEYREELQRLQLELQDKAP